jgi:hypothetical protein
LSPITRLIAAASLASCASLAAAQSSITLFGTTYSVERINISNSILMPNSNNPGETLQLFETEGATYLGNNRMALSADDMSDNYITAIDNHMVEIALTFGPGGPSAAFVRPIALVDGQTSYDLNPSGLTINPTAAGLGAGGNLIVANGDGRLHSFAFNNTNPSTSELEFPAGSGCLTTPGSCGIDLTFRNIEVEDVAFVPLPAGPSFAVINQSLDGPDLSGIELWSTTGSFRSAFSVGGTVTPSLVPAVAKGLTYLAPSTRFPASMRNGALMVSFDRDFPALQAFALDGTLLGTEILTTDGTRFGPRRLDLTGCDGRPLHIESLAADPESGRLFLVNQGVNFTCNYIWILTPVCPADLGGEGGSQGSDGILDNNDFIVFIQLFFDNNPAADLGTEGGAAGSDDNFDNNDFIVFIQAFFEGC